MLLNEGKEADCHADVLCKEVVQVLNGSTNWCKT